MTTQATTTLTASKRMAAAWLAWLMFALSVALFVGGLVLLALTPPGLWGRRSVFWPIDAFNLSVLAYSGVGALIASRRPHNGIGWIFCAMGLIWELNGFAQSYASYLFLTAPASLNANDLILILALSMWVVPFGLTPPLLLLFPNGHILSRRWRLIPRLFGALVLLAFLGVTTDFRAGSTNLQFPSLLTALGIGRGMGLDEPIGAIAQISTLASFVLGGNALVLRLRRARGEERQQLKWFVYAGVLLAVIVVLFGVFFSWLHPLDPEALYEADLFYGIPWAIAFGAIPVAAGIAILRYHLFDIDLLINRTLVYVPLTGIIAGIFASSITLSQKLFVALTGQSSDAATVLTTLIVVAAFDPIKNGLQHLVDRRFKQARDPTRELHAIRDHARALLQVIDIEPSARHLLDAAVRAFDASGGAVFLQQNGEAYVAYTASEWKGDAALRVPLETNGIRLGELALVARCSGADYSEQDRALLEQTVTPVARARWR